MKEREVDRTIVATFILLVVGLFMIVNVLLNTVDEAGGVHGIAVAAGKEIKSIAEDINKDDSND